MRWADVRRKIALWVMIVVFSAAVLCFPRVCEAKTRVYIAVAVSGGIVIGGAYIIWSLVFVERVSSQKKNLAEEVSNAAPYQGDRGEGERVELEPPEFYMPVLSVRF